MSKFSEATNTKNQKMTDEKNDSPVHSREVTSQVLLGSSRCLLIHHDSEIYQLKLTKFGKLVLTK